MGDKVSVCQAFMAITNRVALASWMVPPTPPTISMPSGFNPTASATAGVTIVRGAPVSQMALNPWVVTVTYCSFESAPAAALPTPTTDVIL